MMTSPSQAFVAFPGGFGTLDEVFEVLTLIQTHKMQPVAMILIGKEFWSDLDAFIRKQLLTIHKTIEEKDTQIYSIVDTAEEAMDILKQRIVADEHVHNHEQKQRKKKVARR